MTRTSAENGKQMIAAAKFFVEQNGSTVAGRKVELVIRDDGGVADQAKRIAQDLVVNAKVAVLAGYNPTPSALAVAPIATEAKVPQIVMGASTSIITERSPYIVRTFSTQSQIALSMAQWAAKNGIKRVVTLVSDYAPGIDTQKAFIEELGRAAEKSSKRCAWRCKASILRPICSGPAMPSPVPYSCLFQAA